MDIKQTLTEKLNGFVVAYYNHKQSYQALEAITPKYIGQTTIWVGPHLNAIVTSTVNQYCKRFDHNAHGTRACIDSNEALNALLGDNAKLFDEYDRDFDTLDLHLSAVSNFLSTIEPTSLTTYVKSQASALEETGFTIAARFIADAFELIGCSYTGKSTSLNGNKATLYTKNPARWEFNEVYWENKELASHANKIAIDLRVICEQAGIPCLSSLFEQLQRDAWALSWGEKLPGSYNVIANGAKLRVFKKHISLSISRDTFDGLMAFLVAHLPADERLNPIKAAA